MKRLATCLLLCIFICSLLFSGCSSEEASSEAKDQTDALVQEDLSIALDQYLTIYAEGWDGYGYVGVDMNLKQLKEDCREFLIEDNATSSSSGSNNKTVAERFDDVFEKLTSNDFALNNENDGSLKNGDVVEIAMVAPEKLQALLTVPLEETVLKYTVKTLDPFTPIDPFERINVSYEDGIGTYTLYETASTVIPSPLGTEATITGIIVEAEEGKEYHNGDTVYVKLSEETISSYTEKYGDNYFSRTEGLIELKYLPELPFTENQARELINSLSEVCLDNANYAAKDLMDYTSKEETSVEHIGSMLYYNNGGSHTKGDNLAYNQLVLVYKVTSPSNSEGWYTYMAYSGDMVFAWKLNRGTTFLERTTVDRYSNSLDSHFRFYDNDYFCDGGTDGVPTTFDLNGKTFTGHLRIEDVFAAIEKNCLQERSYDHLVVTDSLASYITEY